MKLASAGFKKAKNISRKIYLIFDMLNMNPNNAEWTMKTTLNEMNVNKIVDLASKNLNSMDSLNYNNRNSMFNEYYSIL